MKKTQTPRMAHTSNSKIGMGTSYGSGVRQPMGKVRDVLGAGNFSKKKLSKPPKQLA